MQRPNLFVCGAAHIDRRARSFEPLRSGASNPGTLREEVGGGALNAARNAKRHGADVSLMSVRGGDMIGDLVGSSLDRWSIHDLSAVFLDRSTPSYTALLDHQGELVSAVADMALYDLAFAKQLRRRKIRDAIDAADAVLCDANMPTDALERLVQSAGERPVFAIAVSPGRVRRLEPVLPALSCLFMNRLETLALSGMSSLPQAIVALRNSGLRRGVITAGEADTIMFDDSGCYSLRPPRSDAIVDVTGAGDALAGAATAALISDCAFPEAVRRGIAASTLTIAAESCVADYDDQTFEVVLASVGAPQRFTEIGINR